MSELTKLCKRVGELLDTVDSVTTGFNASERSTEDIFKLHQDYSSYANEITDKLTVSAEKFWNKRLYSDPVTGSARFGANQVAKIEKLQDDVVLLDMRVKDFLLVLEGEKIIREAQIRELEEEKARAAAEITEYTFIEKEDVMDNAEALAAAEKEREELHQKAEAVRLRKQEDLKSLADLCDRIDALLSATVDKANSAPQKGQVVSEAVEYINTAIKGSQITADAGKMALKTVSSILENIIAHPDDIKLRTMRVDNPQLWVSFVAGASFCA